jgi:hypothetical protein
VDVSQGNNRYEPYFEFVHKNNIFSKYALRHNALMTRGQMAYLAHQLMLEKKGQLALTGNVMWHRVAVARLRLVYLPPHPSLMVRFATISPILGISMIKVLRSNSFSPSMAALIPIRWYAPITKLHRLPREMQLWFIPPDYPKNDQAVTEVILEINHII